MTIHSGSFSLLLARLRFKSNHSLTWSETGWISYWGLLSLLYIALLPPCDTLQKHIFFLSPAILEWSKQCCLHSGIMVSFMALTPSTFPHQKKKSGLRNNNWTKDTSKFPWLTRNLALDQFHICCLCSPICWKRYKGGKTKV